MATITIVSYTGISNRANEASVLSDLSNDSTQLKLYQTVYGYYPNIDSTTKCPVAPSIVDNNYCLKTSSNNKIVYSTYHNLDGTDNTQNFALSVSYNGISYSNNTDDIKCPLNFIIVPGSATYGTKDFCVMKYNAKQVGSSTTPISQASGLPWDNIRQADASTNSSKVAGCTSCHLLTEPEYMTIAQNILSVASNWSGTAVGNGSVYIGHSDGAPTSSLAASNNDNDGYYGTGQTTGLQKRTLTLSNGEVIWDMSGNVREWTSSIVTSNNQPGLSGEVAYAWKQWNNGSLLMNGLPYNSQPASTGIAGITGWSSTQGIGQLYSNHGETDIRAFLRGGDWSDGTMAGVLSLNLIYAGGGGVGTSGSSSVGFRVSR